MRALESLRGPCALLLASLLLAVPACSGGGGGGGGAADDDDDDDDGTVDWSTLTEVAWTLGPGDEDTAYPHTFTLDRDIYVGGIRPIAPLGTHHTVLYRGGGSFNNMIYASGVGTGELLFPEGAGLKLESGETLRLELHIFNASPSELEGTSGVEIVEVPEEDVVNEVDLFLPGPFEFTLDPGEVTEATDVCTITQAQTFFALFPHMHQLGTHFKTTVTTSAGTLTLHDDDYVFEGQAFTPFTPLPVEPGDTITTTCTWNNTTSETVGWGESSNAEMCFSILYRWPALGNGLCSIPF